MYNMAYWWGIVLFFVGFFWKHCSIKSYVLYRFGRSECTRVRLKSVEVVFDLISPHSPISTHWEFFRVFTHFKTNIYLCNSSNRMNHITTTGSLISLLMCKTHYKCDATWDFQQCGMCISAAWSESLLVAWYSMTIKLLTEHHFEFLSLTGGCTGSSESILV